MNLLKKVLILVTLILIILCGLIISVRKGYADEYIKIALENYLSAKGVPTKITDLHFIDNTLSAKLIELKLTDDSTHSRIKDLKVIFSYSGNLLNPVIILTVTASELSLVDKDNIKIINSEFSTEYYLRLMDLSAQTKMLFNSINGNGFNDGSAICMAKDDILKDKEINCRLLLNKELSVEFNSKITKSFGKINKLNAKVNLQNTPLTIYQLAETIIPNNEVIVFLRDYIKFGYASGSLELSLDEEFFKANKLSPNHLKGNFGITDFELKYDKDFPSLKNMDINLSVSGSLMKFVVSKAYSSNTLIKGMIELNWTGISTSNVIITATSQGPAVDLTDFISEKSLQNSKKNGIDLRQITGTATSKISVIIPLEPKSKNFYNMSSEISNVNLKILDNNIDAKKFKISALFNGDQVILKGSGKINGFDSDVDYRYNLSNEAEYEHLLKSKSKINNPHKKLSIITLNSGQAVLNFEYKSKGDQATIKADSNLKNLDFYIDKISIHKSIGENANLTINGDLKSINDGSIAFKLAGANNLQILGKTRLLGNKKETTFPIITYNNTNVQGTVTFDQNTFSTKINGTVLDLSEADMIKFLEKEKDDDTSTKLEVNVEKVFLKNDIKLQDVNLNIHCDKVKCYQGYFDSKIGSKFLKMLLKNFKDKEEWVITSNNAGAVFKGIGMYKNMKAGTMVLVLNTSRQEVKEGEIIPILDGTFTFKKFGIKDTPFLTRLVSFISLPGFISILRDNKDIVFSNMSGNLSYTNNIMTVSNASADGPYFDFTMTGTVDTKNHSVKLKGNVIPSLYGISTILKNVPILSKLLSGGHRKGIVFAPYSIEQKY